MAKPSALFRAAVLLACLGLAAAAAGAEPGGLKADLDFFSTGEADLGGGRGAYATYSGRAELTYRGFSLSYQEYRYQWSDPGKLPFGNGRDDPWERLRRVGVGYTRHGELNQRWSYLASAGVSSGFEEEMNDSYQARGVGLFTYRWDQRWLVSLGAGGQYHKVRSVLLPAGGVSYNLHAPSGPYFALGYPLTAVGYRLSPAWALNWGVLEFNRNYYRLAEDSTVRRGGYLETRDLVSSTWVAFTPRKGLKLEAGLRYLFNRELNTFDVNAENERGHDVDNAWGAFARLSLEF